MAISVTTFPYPQQKLSMLDAYREFLSRLLVKQKKEFNDLIQVETGLYIYADLDKVTTMFTQRMVSTSIPIEIKKDIVSLRYKLECGFEFSSSYVVGGGTLEFFHCLLTPGVDYPGSPFKLNSLEKAFKNYVAEQLSLMTEPSIFPHDYHWRVIFSVKKDYLENDPLTFL